MDGFSGFYPGGAGGGGGGGGGGGSRPMFGYRLATEGLKP